MSLRRPLLQATNRSGLTRTEVLVLVGVIVVLCAVATGPVHSLLEARSIARGVESAHTLNTLLSQYATDNNGVYPVGENTRAPGKSEGIALDLLQNNYIPNADIFSVGSTPKYHGAAKDYSDLAPENMSWDFTAGATMTTGITTSAPGLLPVLYTTGQTVGYPAPGKGLDLVISGQGPFGPKGIVVAYKGGHALFLEATKSEPRTCVGFVSPDFKDTGTHTQIKP